MILPFRHYPISSDDFDLMNTSVPRKKSQYKKCVCEALIVPKQANIGVRKKKFGSFKVFGYGLIQIRKRKCDLNERIRIRKLV